MSDERQEMMNDFVAESRELLNDIEPQITKLEKQALVSGEISDEILNTIFCLFHSIKGMASFLDLETVIKVTHETETLLDLVRKGQVVLEPEHVDVLFRTSDFVRSLLDVIEQQLSDGGYEQTAGHIIADIHKVTETSEDEENGVAIHREAVSLKRMPPAKAESGNFCNKDETGKGANWVKVDADKLDRLLGLTEELSGAEPFFYYGKFGASDLLGITREIKTLAREMRFATLGATFHKMTRLARELALKKSLKVNLEITGGEIEVDKEMIDFIADSLVHMIRNAVDHGLETPCERLRAGKPEAGRILLEAKYCDSEVWITVKDDGRGLDCGKILEKAEKIGLVQGDERAIQDKRVWNLVFKPGLSTAQTVTAISGRGMGMDAVRRNMEKLQGKVDIESKCGQGSAFILRIPNRAREEWL
jgi:two-component system chemotaxis sensor kinase CheA